MRYRVVRDLLSQLYIYCLMGTLVFTTSILVLQLIRFTKFLIEFHVSLLDLLSLLGYMCFSFLPVVVPTAMVFSALTVFGRFVEKKEWLGVLTCGIGYRKFLFPVIVYFALPLSLMCLYFGLEVVPWGNQQVKNTVEAIYNKKSLTSIQKKTFLNVFDGVVLFVHDLDTQANVMKKVFLFDERKPNAPLVVTAKTGTLHRDIPKETLELALSEGMIQSHNVSESSLKLMQYKSLNIEAHIGFKSKGAFPAVMSLRLNELEQKIQEFKEQGKKRSYLEYLIDYHRRFALPAAAFVLVLFGFALPLSSQKRYIRLSPIIQSFVVMLVYWVIYIVNNVLVQQGIFPAWFGLWFSVVVFFALSIQLLISKRIMY